MELLRTDGGYVVRVSAGPHALEQGIEESVLCGEILNYALGKTIERDRAGDGAAPGGAA
jgi:ribosomal protein S4E